MKVLLINPWYPVKEFLYRVSRITPPLGIAYIASVLRSHDHEVGILDMVAANVKPDHLEEYLTEEMPDAVGMSVSTPTVTYADRCASEIKQVLPEAHIIVGGAHPTLQPQDTFRETKNADYLLRGECEYTFLELVEALESSNQSRIRKIAGVGIREDNFFSDTIAVVEHLDSLPFPAFDLLDMEAYYESHNPERRFFPMMSSRGCPYQCIFCNTPTLHGRRFRARSPGNVVEEMKILVNAYGMQHVLFYDDTFTMDMKRAESICDEILRSGLEVSWRVRTRVDRVNRKLLTKMKNAGCNVVSYGVETSSERLLEVLEKQYSIEDVRKAFQLTKEAGIKILAYFMFGIPTEKREDAERTIKLAGDLDPDYALFNILTPLPGSKSYDMMKENLTTENWSDFIGVKPIVSSKQLSDEDLKILLDKAYETFYIRKEWLTNRIKNATSPKDVENDINTFFFYLEKTRKSET